MFQYFLWIGKMPGFDDVVLDLLDSRSPPANRAAEPSRGAVTPAAGAFPIVIRLNETVLFIWLLNFFYSETVRNLRGYTIDISSR